MNVPGQKSADICAGVAGVAITISFATLVDAVQLIAALISVITGAWSLYFNFIRHRAKKKRRRR